MVRLVINTLGPLGVTLDGLAITGLTYHKMWALFVYLAQSASRFFEEALALLDSLDLAGQDMH
jgi:hypothetical protein